MAKIKEILIERGATYRLEVRWETEEIVYKNISGITQTGPIAIHVPSHGLKNGWPVAVVNVVGMTEINAEANNVKSSDYHRCTVVDVDHITFNDVNAAGFKAYVSGGQIQFQKPQDLSGYTPRMDIKDRIGGTILASSEIANTPLDIITLTADSANFVTEVEIEPADTAAILWKKGVTHLEMVGPGGIVSRLKLTSTGADDEPDPVRVSGEVTTS